MCESASKVGAFSEYGKCQSTLMSILEDSSQRSGQQSSVTAATIQLLQTAKEGVFNLDQNFNKCTAGCSRGTDSDYILQIMCMQSAICSLVLQHCNQSIYI